MGDGKLLVYLRMFFLMCGLIAGVWVLRGGAEVRKVARVDDEHLHLGLPGREHALELDRIQRIEFQPPFSRSRKLWLPAAALIDEFGQSWRLPATIESGDRLVLEIVERSGDDELATWADALGVPRRMSRPGWTVAIGYATAVAIVIGSLLRMVF